MIEPNVFYGDRKFPDENIRQSLWKSIQEAISSKRPSSVSFHRRSFVLGMAASFLLILAGVGTYTSVKEAVDYSQPNIVKLDRAYQAAIREFERLASHEDVASTSPENRSVLSTRKEQLRLLEQAINDLRQETSSNDLSGIKRARLRDLYGKKLKLLQEMVEQGEIEL